MTKPKYPLNQKIGIIGGGQLGKMMILEAKKMGFFVAVLDPFEKCPCHSISDEHIVADFDDEPAIKRLADMCDVITYEFEHIGVNQLEKIEKSGKTVYPTCKSLKIIQDKFLQKTALKDAGLPVPNFCTVASTGEIKSKISEYPQILKTAKGGYDGKGNYVISHEEDIETAFTALGGENKALMLEQYIVFIHEISVLACRAADGEIAIYPPSKNIHKDSILEKTIVPAPISDNVSHKCVSLARDVMNVFEGVGMFCVEMFVCGDGSVYINEVAPRPHNSGHYTIEACTVSQFEQHIRAVAGLPLGKPRLLTPVVMANILGEDGYDGIAAVTGCLEALKTPGLTLHIYDKKFTKPKRKMGHLTVCGDDIEMCIKLADSAVSQIKVISEERT